MIRIPTVLAAGLTWTWFWGQSWVYESVLEQRIVMKETVGETFYPGFRRSTAQFGVLAAFIVAVAVAATIRTVIRSVSATGLITATCFGLTGSLLVWTWSIRWVASMNLTYVQRQAAFEVFILAVTSGLLVVAAITAAAARYSSSHRNSEAETSAVSALEP